MAAVNLRINGYQAQRAEALTDFIASDPDLAALCGGNVTRGDVLRIALERGLRSLEEDDTMSEDGEDGDVPTELPANPLQDDNGSGTLADEVVVSSGVDGDGLPTER